MKKMSLLLLILLIIGGTVLFVGCGGDDDDDDNDTSNENFFPMQDGNQWKFEIQYTNAATETIDSVDTMWQEVIGDSLYEPDGNTYKKVMDLPDTILDLYRADDQYLWTVKYFGSPANTDIKFRSVKLNPSVGDTWTTTTNISMFDVHANGECRSIETLELPIGTLDNCYHIVLKTESRLASDSIHTWIVPELGPVKYLSYYTEDDIVKHKVRELIEYNIAE